MKLIDGDMLKSIIDNMPGSIIERRKAEWIRTKITYGDNQVLGLLECSHCLCQVTEESNYCPYCGYYMRGDKE